MIQCFKQMISKTNKIKQTIKKKKKNKQQNPKDEKLSVALNKQSLQKNKGDPLPCG